MRAFFLYTMSKKKVKNHNPSIASATAKVTGESLDMVVLMWDCVSQFAQDQIKLGELNVIQLPYLGKLAPNYKRINKINAALMAPKQEIYEPVPGDGKLRVRVKQGLDIVNSRVRSNPEEGQGK